MNYTLPIAPGRYNVILFFCELYWTSPYMRIFNVNVNGERVLTNFDIYGEVLFANPDIKTFPVVVTGGPLVIEFIPIAGFNFPKISGIEVDLA